MKVRLWLSVYEHTAPMGTSELWVKDLATDFAPGTGDTVYLWPDEEDGDTGGVGWTVRRRYWDAAGLVHLEMTYMVKDPTDDMQRILLHDNGRHYASSWWVDRDGQPEPALRLGGWLPYDEAGQDPTPSVP
jgi:hypothetical protein